MGEHALLQIAALMILGVGATWLAALMRVPSILLLLVIGFIAGPVTGLLEPESVFGEALFPLVSLSVALILFEGGLQLQLNRIRETRTAVVELVLGGSLITLVLCTILGHWLLGLSWSLSVLLGSILVVTGPTVIMPMLRNIRPAGRIGAVIRWEGIINDPLGALLAFLVYEWIRAGQEAGAVGLHLGKLFLSLASGVAFGVAGAVVLLLLLRRFWVPDHLQNPFSLMMALAVFTLSNAVMAESGLLAVTLMGVVLANQHKVELHHVVAFQEDVRVLLIGFLFILLSARIELAIFADVGWETLVFVALLILLVRPAAVFLSTLGARVSHKERLLLAWMAPRGIVAAAVSSVFAIRLSEYGIAGAERLLSIVFTIIVATVAVYGLTAKPLAVRLGLATRRRDGVLFVGANALVRDLAVKLKEFGVRTVLISNHPDDVRRANDLGLTAFDSNFLDRHSLEELELTGIGNMVALSASDELNLLAILQWEEFFGRKFVYHPLHDPVSIQTVTTYRLRGRLLGHPPKLFAEIMDDHKMGELSITEDPLALRSGPGTFWPIFVFSEEDGLAVVTGEPVAPGPGDLVLGIATRDLA